MAQCLVCTLGYAQSSQLHTPPTSTIKVESTTQHIESHQTENQSLWKKILATSYALGPGIVVSGGGHYIMNQEQAAKKLFWIKISGLGGVILGGTLLAKSGASNLATPWVIPLLITSATAFIGSSLLDLIGIWSQSKANTHLPKLHIAPLTDYKGSFVLNASMATRQTAIEPYHLLSTIHWVQQINMWAYDLQASWIDLQQRYELHIERSITQGQGWSLWGRLGGLSHLNQSADFSFYQGELTLQTSFRLGQLIAPSLNALSSDLWVGWGGGAVSYGSDSSDQITTILGGMRFTHHSFNDHLRVATTYDHRHDGWTGGAIIPGLGSGILGSLEVSISTRIGKYFWLESSAKFGSAHIGSIMLSWYGDHQ